MAVSGPFGQTRDLVAHRAGNSTADAGRAAAQGYTVEFDVHRRRGRLEVRHAKALWLTRRLWDRWYLLPTRTTVPALTEILHAAGPAAALLVDVKSPSPRVARQIAEILGDRDQVVVSSRMWWTLSVFRRRQGWKTLRSCGNRLQLWAALRLPRVGLGHGIGVHERLVTPAVAARLTGRADMVYVWGAKDRRRCLELLELGVTGLIVDDVGLVSPEDL